MKASLKILEACAVLFNLLYTLFYLRQHPICFVFGIAGPLLFIILTLQRKIYADTLLQVFYIAVTIYGIAQWGGEWRKEHWSLGTHIRLIIAATLFASLTAYLLKKYTDAKLPVIDSFNTAFAMLGTWLMMNFVHENWLYFIAVNLVSMIIFTKRKLFLSVGMFFVYLLMAIDGYWELGWFECIF